MKIAKTRLTFIEHLRDGRKSFHIIAEKPAFTNSTEGPRANESVEYVGTGLIDKVEGFCLNDRGTASGVRNVFAALHQAGGLARNA
jgi:hypothetical protein